MLACETPKGYASMQLVRHGTIKYDALPPLFFFRTARALSVDGTRPWLQGNNRLPRIVAGLQNQRQGVPSMTRILALAVAVGLLLAACGNGQEGGEAGTPPENIPESDPQGVGGTSNN